ncbi:20858_t:CDS:2, partial [Rhizophagus irregularis]
MKDESIYIRVIFDKKRFIWIQLRAAGLAETEPLSSMTIKWFLVYKAVSYTRVRQSPIAHVEARSFFSIQRW